jgi:hypothetical protein
MGAKRSGGPWRRPSGDSRRKRSQKEERRHHLKRGNYARMHRWPGRRLKRFYHPPRFPSICRADPISGMHHRPNRSLLPTYPATDGGDNQNGHYAAGQGGESTGDEGDAAPCPVRNAYARGRLRNRLPVPKASPNKGLNAVARGRQPRLLRPLVAAPRQRDGDRVAKSHRPKRPGVAPLLGSHRSPDGPM